MPWKITEDSRCPASKPYGVVGGSSGDHLAGCHPSREAAKKQMAALYAAESKTLADDQSQALDEVDGTHYPVYTQPYHTPPSIAW